MYLQVGELAGRYLCGSVGNVEGAVPAPFPCYMKNLPYKFNSAESCVYKGLKRTLLRTTFSTSARITAEFLVLRSAHDRSVRREAGVNENIRSLVKSFRFHKFKVFPKTVISQTEIPAFVDSWVTNTPSVTTLCPQRQKMLRLTLS
jgi:hypothetical protein